MTARGTTARTGVTLDLHPSQHRTTGVTAWATKSDALRDLAALRACGLNIGADIEAHPALTHLDRVWVLSRPDHHAGITYLMTSNGTWIPGRLDGRPCFHDHNSHAPACRDNGGHITWTAGGNLEPATVTHTYTYTAGQYGVTDGNGRTLMSAGWLDAPSVPLTHWGCEVFCIACNWSWCDSDEDTARARARHHRAHPQEYADHATPRRRPTLAGSR